MYQRPIVDSGDTPFGLISAALVLLMTPGLALFYDGLVQRKHVVAIMAQSFLAMGIVAILWAALGFSLAFGPDHGGIIGGLDYAGMRNVGLAPSRNANYGPTIPFLAFFTFQLMFAVITPALITGAFADRVRLKAYVPFLILWSLLVYAPLAHWVGGGGFLQAGGVRDFAGGIVVHLSAGFGALASILVIGPRRLEEGENPQPHNVPLVALGRGLLWFGWFGFNAGSALTVGNGVAVYAFLHTMFAASTGLVTWMVPAWWRNGHPSLVGGLTGAVAALATVTPASGFVAPWASMVIGFLASVVCYTATLWRARHRWDDSLDVWGVHGVGGALGILLTGLLAQAFVNNASGLVEGNGMQFLVQLAAVIIAILYTFAVTYVLLRLMKFFLRLRVAPEEERGGLDMVLHGERAYGEP